MRALLDVRRRLAGASAQEVQSRPDRILSLAEVNEFNGKIRESLGIPYERIFFGMPLSRAIEVGYKVTARGYFDATESVVAEHTAKTIRRIACAYPVPPKQPLRLLDLFAGTGQTSWSFVRVGFEVESTEVDRIRATVALHNIKHSAIDDHWKLHSIDSLSLLDQHAKSGTKFDAVYLDPPWSGNYDYDLSRPFLLENMTPSGAVLIEKSLQISDVVALKCPRSISRPQLEDLCRSFELWGKFEYQDVAGLPPELNQSTAYFVKRSRYPHLLEESVTLSRGALS